MSNPELKIRPKSKKPEVAAAGGVAAIGPADLLIFLSDVMVDYKQILVTRTFGGLTHQ